MIPFSIRNRSRVMFSPVGCLSATFLIAAHFLNTASLAREPYKRVEKFLATEVTILGQPIVYPTGGPSRVVAVIVTLKPGSARLHNGSVHGSRRCSEHNKG